MDRSLMLSELTRDERCELKPYQDSRGVMTIGIGRNLQKGLVMEEVLHLFKNDLDEVEGELDHAYPWWQRLDEVRQRVLANMCFNMGITRLAGFTQTLHYIQTGQYDAAAKEMLNSAWAKQVGPRAIRLSDMMKTGAV